jgi:malonyl-CoA O-methyltransferase
MFLTNIQAGFSKASKTYDAAAFVQQEVGHRLLSRLDYLRFTPTHICDLGGGTGVFSEKLTQQYPNAMVVTADLSLAMLQTAQQKARTKASVCMDAHKMSFASESFDLIFCNAVFQWCSDLRVVLQECQRLLKPNGLLLFSTFGPDTLKEIKHSWSEVDNLHHVHAFADMHDFGDALAYLQYQDPVMDTEILTIEYPNPHTALRDLKGIGAQNRHPERPRHLMGKKRFQAFLTNLNRYRLPHGSYPMTYEVLYGTAWRGNLGKLGVMCHTVY